MFPETGSARVARAGPSRRTPRARQDLHHAARAGGRDEPRLEAGLHPGDARARGRVDAVDRAPSAPSSARTPSGGVGTVALHQLRESAGRPWPSAVRVMLPAIPSRPAGARAGSGAPRAPWRRRSSRRRAPGAAPGEHELEHGDVPAEHPPAERPPPEERLAERAEGAAGRGPARPSGDEAGPPLERLRRATVFGPAMASIGAAVEPVCAQGNLKPRNLGVGAFAAGAEQATPARPRTGRRFCGPRARTLFSRRAPDSSR